MKSTDLVRTYFIIFYFIIGGLFMYIIYVVYNNYNVKKIELPNVANANRRFPTIDVHFFHTKWCPWCKKVMPAWKIVVKE